MTVPTQTVFRKVLIANRGAIACRIIKTLDTLGIASVVVYSDADAESLAVQRATQAVRLSGNTAAETYLDGEKILAIAKRAGAQGIHPGYGFLSENVEFADACEKAGIAFIGPTSQQIAQFGLKHTARTLAEENGVPLIEGSGLIDDLPQALRIADTISYPIMLKSTAGGGGIGMQVCEDAEALSEAYDSVKRLSQNNFGNDGLFIEKYISHARHIEVQVVGDGKGKVLALGDRDCSLQRRNQKVIEEAPAPNIDEPLRQAMTQAALRLTKAVNYRSVGTVEFILDAKNNQFYFLEVNTRLQVEHGVTEMITGVDLVRCMLDIAAGNDAFFSHYQHQPKGHSIQARLYAEDPGKDFLPSVGLLTQVVLSPLLRCDTWIETGITVPSYYDPMLAKLIAHGSDRQEAIDKLSRGLQESAVEGIATNRSYLEQVLRSDAVQKAQHTTGFLNSFQYSSNHIEVLKPGTQSTVQDWPGRVGYWDVGVPPSGPMDNLSFSIGNKILGNVESAAGLECTLQGPTLKFRCATVIALTGAKTKAILNGQEVNYYQPIVVPSDSVLDLGKITGTGLRTYLCVKEGLQVPLYMNSRSTFTLGKFGGHGGRQLQAGDLLAIKTAMPDGTELAIPRHRIPDIEPLAGMNKLEFTSDLENNTQWHINVIYGPQGAPDFFTPEDINAFFAAQWEVHFNSSRTGVRLIGPKPCWARQDGGEAGLHPSNIHDNAYAIGAVDFTGDMPVILGPDGPSLGGFVCPVTITKADLWKVGQLSPGDRITFNPVSFSVAEKQFKQQQDFLSALTTHDIPKTTDSEGLVSPRLATSLISPIIFEKSETDKAPAVCYRVAGDDNILVEYGPMVLDLELRFRVHGLMTWLQAQSVPGVIDLTPGIRSLQIHYDNLTLSQSALIDWLKQGEESLDGIEDTVVPTRIIHLPLSWDDEATRVAIDKYQTTVRPNAPWCPSNIDFIRRINGLDSVDDVKRIVFDAHYLVIGLGDVYLGAPVATPLDPRHRLVTTKYNPARTWTPENAVGIGGAYLCIYGMEGPGGYQLVGRTIQMWNAHRQSPSFIQPWLLRFFDQIRFYPVSHEELMEYRRLFPLGQFTPKIEYQEFSLQNYREFLSENDTEIKQFKTLQQKAFETERQHWIDTGLNTFESEVEVPTDNASIQLNADEEGARSPVRGSVWKVTVSIDESVKKGDTVAIIESMKTEFSLEAPMDGTVSRILVKEGDQISTGDVAVAITISNSVNH